MARVVVDSGALARWSADAGRARARLAGALDEVDTAVDGLAAGWEGAAAERFRRHVQAWRVAAERLLGTLAELTQLAQTARSNYAAAAAANRRTWYGLTEPAAAGPAGSGGRGPGPRIDADVEDIRGTVATLAAVAEALVGAWARLSRELSGTSGMAGDDELGRAFGHHHDAVAAAAWQGWRATAILLTAVLGGLAETGSNIADAEHRSNAAVTGPAPIVVAPGVPVPALPPPPSAAGQGRDSPVGPLAGYWPAADPQLLRAAAATWRTAAAELGAHTEAVTTALAALVQANPDPTLAMARDVAARTLSRDASTGLCGLLEQHCGQLATACLILAEATERTRCALRDAILAFLAPDEWYQPVAAVLDVVLTRGAAKLVALGGDLVLLTGELDAIRLQHERAAQPAVAMLDPAAADRLSRAATSLVPPAPVSSAGCAVTAPTGLPEDERRRLLEEAASSGMKIDPAQTLQIVRTSDGRIVWVERGDGRSGLAHLVRAERVAQFAGRGVAPEEIPTIAVRALTEGTALGPVRGDGEAYQVRLGDRTVDIVVVVGSNGYLVTAYPLDSRRAIRGGAR